MSNEPTSHSAPREGTAQVSAPELARASLGFRDGINGPHAARTMMLDDVSTLFARLAPSATRQEYAAEIIEANCLAKPTRVARELSFRYLAALYGLDPAQVLFRGFRRLWDLDPRARPVLALTFALARDPLLRSTRDFILGRQTGEAVHREELEHLIADTYPDRFTPASLKSFAQNVSGTWSQAGYLIGRTPKYRTAPTVTATNVTFCLFLGYLEGMTGPRLFTSHWTRTLHLAPDIAEELATAASRQGQLVFLNAGGVKEIRFPGYLTEQDEAWRLEAAHVV